jgi:hypothetical protein
MSNNNLLNRISAVLSDAGFLITGFSQKPWKNPIIKLKIAESITKKNELDIPKSLMLNGKKIFEGQQDRLSGEIVNLGRVMNASSLTQTLEYIKKCSASMLNVGDFIITSFDVPAAEHKGLKFNNLKVINAKIVIVDIKPDRVVFCFDEIQFLSAVNEKNTNKGGFSESALCEYLNREFAEAMNITDLLIKTKDGNVVTLPTAYEVFGKTDYFKTEANYAEEPYQFEYFKKVKNKIKVKFWDDDTYPYWLSTAAHAAVFAICSYIGSANNNSAGSVYGCVPAFCVSLETHL